MSCVFIYNLSSTIYNYSNTNVAKYLKKQNLNKKDASISCFDKQNYVFCDCIIGGFIAQFFGVIIERKGK